jgi:hypothetical protein
MERTDASLLSADDPILSEDSQTQLPETVREFMGAERPKHDRQPTSDETGAETPPDESADQH